ncbi:MAG: hypothetical protein U7123_07320 [Potamolinea sp.]
MQATDWAGTQGTTSDYPVENRLNNSTWLNASIRTIIKQKSRFECSEIKSPPPPEPPRFEAPSLPPLPPKECDCMKCCQDNENLLKALLREVKKANQAIDSDNLIKGVSLPTDIRKPGEKKAYKSLLEAQLWHANNTFNSIGGLPGELTGVPAGAGKTRTIKFNSLTEGILETLAEIVKEGNNNSAEKLAKIAQVLAVDDYLKGEVQVSSDFTDPKSELKKLNNIPETLLWQAEQNYNMIGSLPVEIEIEDTDLVAEGNQSKKIEIRNISEGIAEILGSNLVSRTVEDANFNASMRTLAEMGAVRQTVTSVFYNIQGIIEYLGYSISDKITKIPMSFTPGAETVDKALKESQQDNVHWENTDKINLQKQLKELLLMSAVFMGQNFVKAGKWGAEQLGKYLGKKEATSTGNNEDEFDTFLNELENEFGQNTDIANPYGRSFSERPKIIQKGDTSDGANK